MEKIRAAGSQLPWHRVNFAFTVEECFSLDSDTTGYSCVGGCEDMNTRFVSNGHLRLFKTRSTAVILPLLRQICNTASPIGSSIAGEMVHFCQVKKCYPCVATVE